MVNIKRKNQYAKYEMEILLKDIKELTDLFGLGKHVLNRLIKQKVEKGIDFWGYDSMIFESRNPKIVRKRTKTDLKILLLWEWACLKIEWIKHIYNDCPEIKIIENKLIQIQKKWTKIKEESLKKFYDEQLREYDKSLKHIK